MGAVSSPSQDWIYGRLGDTEVEHHLRTDSASLAEARTLLQKAVQIGINFKARDQVYERATQELLDSWATEPLPLEEVGVDSVLKELNDNILPFVPEPCLPNFSM
jgi:hypothetical protein